MGSLTPMTRKGWIYLGIGVATGLFLLFRKKRLRGLTILHVGDSHAGGLAPHLEALFMEAGADYTNVHRDGWSTHGFADSGLTSDRARRLDPDIVIVTLGTNDGNNPNATFRGASAIIAQANEGSVPVSILWTGPPDMPRADLQELLPSLVETLLEAISPAANARFLDSRRISIAFNGGAVHPTREGYKTWAKAIFSAV